MEIEEIDWYLISASIGDVMLGQGLDLEAFISSIFELTFLEVSSF